MQYEGYWIITWKHLKGTIYFVQIWNLNKLRLATCWPPNTGIVTLSGPRSVLRFVCKFTAEPKCFSPESPQLDLYLLSITKCFKLVWKAYLNNIYNIPFAHDFMPSLCSVSATHVVCKPEGEKKALRTSLKSSDLLVELDFISSYWLCYSTSRNLLLGSGFVSPAISFPKKKDIA